MKSPSRALLTQLVEIDASRDVALIALSVVECREKQIGVARLCGEPNSRRCEFAVTVGDAWQRKGLGSVLMQHLIEGAVSRKFESMYSIDASDNDSMRHFASHLGMQRATDPNDSSQVVHSLDLTRLARPD